MSYVVLARKLRPIRFDDLVGQETTAQILKNALLSNRVAHAFLFSGSRGTGKTSCARILTKAINCLHRQGAEPCNQCENCIDISNNASPDIYEIDAASNRGIDNIRELRDNLSFAPARCTFKVYIIDEAHMLTTESFNALLKTLEEPPAHVKFILATTDPHKIPQTIISRCQRYDFLRIPLQQMADYLERITKTEHIQLSRRALEMVARAAIGGMRDALTSIDQIIGFSGTQATDEQVAQVLGVGDTNLRLSLLKTLVNKDASGAMAQFYKMLEHGHDFRGALAELLQSVKTLSLIQAVGANSAFFQNYASDELREFSALAQTLGFDELQQIFHILLELENQINQSHHAQVCFEMAILQITSVTPLIGVKDLIAQIQNLNKALPKKTSGPKEGGNTNHGESSAPRGASRPPKVPSPSEASASFGGLPKQPYEHLECPPAEEQGKATFMKASSTDGDDVTTYDLGTKTDSGEETLSNPSVEYAKISAIKAILTSPATSPNRPSAVMPQLPSELSRTSPVLTKAPEMEQTAVSSPEMKADVLPESWIQFVEYIQTSHQQLGSLLKNAIPLEVTQQRVCFGFKRPQYLEMWSSEKLSLLEKLSESYFHYPAPVVCEANALSTPMLTLREMQHKEALQEQERRRQAAVDNHQVQTILKVFKGSRISEINIPEN
ncbi:DNA polymerase III subunit gamma/tau [Deltaproteobacteria bacterium TL4]